MSENNNEDDILVGGSGTDSLTARNGEDDKYRLVVIGLSGEYKSGKSRYLSALGNRCFTDVQTAEALLGKVETVELQPDLTANSETENNSEYSAEIDEIFARLHETDSRIAESRQNTVQLGIETRSMLDDLRKQLG